MKKSILIIALTCFFILPNLASAEDKGWIIGKPEKGYYEIFISPNIRASTVPIKEMFQSQGGQRLTKLGTSIRINNTNRSKMRIISNNARFVGVRKGRCVIHAPEYDSELIDFALSRHKLVIDHTGSVSYTHLTLPTKA